MALEISIQCSESNGIAFACSRVITEMCLFISIIILIMIGIYKVKQHMHRFSYEILPLSSTLLQAILQLVMAVFYQNLLVYIATIYVEISTFSMVGFSFAQLYLKLTLDEEQDQKKRKKQLVLVQLIWMILNFTFMGLTLGQIFQINCDNLNGSGYWIAQVCLIITVLTTNIFGYLVIKEIKKFEQKNKQVQIEVEVEQNMSLNLSNNLESGKHKESLLSKDQKLFKQNYKQIYFIMLTFILTFLVQIGMDEIRNSRSSDTDFTKDFFCNTDKIRFQPKTTGGEIFMFFYALIQIFSCTLIPYTFYIVPLMKTKGEKLSLKQSIFGDSSFTDPQQDENNPKNDKTPEKSQNSKTFVMQQNFDFMALQKDDFDNNKSNSQSLIFPYNEKENESQSQLLLLEKYQD